MLKYKWSHESLLLKLSSFLFLSNSEAIRFIVRVWNKVMWLTSLTLPLQLNSKIIASRAPLPSWNACRPEARVHRSHFSIISSRFSKLSRVEQCCHKLSFSHCTYKIQTRNNVCSTRLSIGNYDYVLASAYWGYFIFFVNWITVCIWCRKSWKFLEVGLLHGEILVRGWCPCVCHVSGRL